MDQITLAANLLRANRYLTLATAGRSGPWASPLAFTVEPDFSLVFYSAVESIHCKNLSKDDRVSGAIFDSTSGSDDADGLQFSGRGAEVREKDIDGVMQRYFEMSFPDSSVRQRWLRPREDFLGKAPQRFYRISISDLFKLDPNSSKVDRRLELDVKRVASAYFAG